MLHGNKRSAAERCTSVAHLRQQSDGSRGGGTKAAPFGCRAVAPIVTADLQTSLQPPAFTDHCFVAGGRPLDSGGAAGALLRSKSTHRRQRRRSVQARGPASRLPPSRPPPPPTRRLPPLLSAGRACGLLANRKLRLAAAGSYIAGHAGHLLAMDSGPQRRSAVQQSEPAASSQLPARLPSPPLLLRLHWPGHRVHRPPAGAISSRPVFLAGLCDAAAH